MSQDWVLEAERRAQRGKLEIQRKEENSYSCTQILELAQAKAHFEWTPVG